MLTIPSAPEDLKRIDIFQGLTLPQLDLIAPMGNFIRIPQSMVFARAGEMVPALYSIIEGQVELHATAPHVGDITMRVAGPGESFPLAALVGTGRLVTSARATTKIGVITFSVARLNHLCDTRPEIGRRVYANVAGILADRYRASLNQLGNALQAGLFESGDYWANI